jgi:Xaa-Pro aminopeptidase
MSRRCPSVFLWAFAGLILLVPPVRAQADAGKEAVAPDEDRPSLLAQPRAVYQARRRALMEQVKELEAKHGTEAREAHRKDGSSPLEEVIYEPVVVLVGQDEGPLNILTDGKFRQKNDFAYLTGVETPFACLILLPNQGRETLYLPPSSPTEKTLEEESDGPGDATAAKLGFARVESTEAFLADLFRAIGDPRKPMRGRTRVPVVYTISKEGRLAVLGGDSGLVRMVREGAPNTEINDVTPLLAEMRKAKSGREIALIHKAIDITAAAQDQVIRTIRPGRSEFELEAKIQAVFTGQGSQRPGFPSIVGSGPNSTIPHYFANRRTLEDGDLVVVDIGAELHYYTADITRTYPANGKFSPRQRAIYQLVLDAQKTAEAGVKPGETKLRELTHRTREFLQQSPLRAKDRDGHEQTMDCFFIHGLSHYLGMDVHDVGDTSKPIQVGEVFTIEPGLYIPSESLGVRIEDDYLVTEHGLEKLSKAIPSDPDEIERLIAQARTARESSASHTMTEDTRQP